MFVPHQHVAYIGMLVQHVIDGYGLSTRHAKNGRDAILLQALDKQLCAVH
jgi:hypothetical protein